MQRAADTALYDAKAAGRRRVATHGGPISQVDAVTITPESVLAPAGGTA
jgi:hypothetical protein